MGLLGLLSDQETHDLQVRSTSIRRRRSVRSTEQVVGSNPVSLVKGRIPFAGVLFFSWILDYYVNRLFPDAKLLCFFRKSDKIDFFSKTCYAVVKQAISKGEINMAKFISLIPGCEIENAAEDFRAAVKVEQYRVGKAAVYLPAGFKWEYIPLSALVSVDGSHRSVTAGHCVTVTERKPAVALMTAEKSFTLNLDRIESVQKVLDAIGK